METLVVGGATEGPRGNDEELAGCASIEAALRGFPVLADGFFLQDDEGKMTGEGFRNHTLLAFGDARSDEDGTVFGQAQEAVTLLGILRGEVCRDALGIFTMEEDLDLFWILQQKEVAKGCIFAVVNPEMQAALHEVGNLLAKLSTEGVLIHVATDIGEGVGVADNAVVVALMEEERAVRGRRNAFGRTRRNSNGRREGRARRNCNGRREGRTRRKGKGGKGVTVPEGSTEGGFLQAPPGLCATGLKAANDEAKVLVLRHGFPHTNEDVEMVGHQDDLPYLYIGIALRYFRDFILKNLLCEGRGLKMGIIRGSFLRASGSCNGTKDALTTFDGEGQHVDARLAVVVPRGTTLAVGFCSCRSAACSDVFFARHERLRASMNRSSRSSISRRGMAKPAARASAMGRV